MSETERGREEKKTTMNGLTDWVNSCQEYNQIVEISMKLKGRIKSLYDFVSNWHRIALLFFDEHNSPIVCMVDFFLYSICFVTQKMRRIYNYNAI